VIELHAGKISLLTPIVIVIIVTMGAFISGTVNAPNSTTNATSNKLTPQGDPVCISNGYLAAEVVEPSDTSGVGVLQFLVGPCTTESPGSNTPLTYPSDSFMSVNVFDAKTIYVTGLCVGIVACVSSENGETVVNLDNYTPVLLSATTQCPTASCIAIQWTTTEGLVITQTINVEGSTAATSAIFQTVSVSNPTSTSHTIGVRYLWDYFVNSYDGTWIQEYSGTTANAIIGVETNFTDPGSIMTSYAMGPCYDTSPTPSCTSANFGTSGGSGSANVTAYGSITTPTGVTVPSDYVYGWWGSQHQTAYFYTANSNLCDSSVNPNQIGSFVPDVGGCQDSSGLYYFGGPAGTSIVSGGSISYAAAITNSSSAVVMTPTSTATLSSATGAVPEGTSVTDTATVTSLEGSAVPAGTVQFYLCPDTSSAATCSTDPSNAFGSPVTLSSTGTATSPAVSSTSTPNDNAAGFYCWSAVYTPSSDSSFAGSSSTTTTNECFQTQTSSKDATSTSISCTPSTITVTETSTCTVTIVDTINSESTPSGTVGFSSSSSTVGTVGASCTLTAGKCTVTFTGAAPGTATVTGTYDGDSTHNGSTVTSNIITVEKDNTSTVVACTPSSIVPSGTSTCTATVTDTTNSESTPSGSVGFTPSNSTVGTVGASCSLVDGSCSATFTGSAAGSATVNTTYNGDTRDNSSSGRSNVITVTAATTKPVLLTFKGCDLDDYDNGTGQLQVFVNGHLVVDIPAGLNNLTGSGDYAPYTDRCINYGPFNISNDVVSGQNNITFTDLDQVEHSGRVGNVTIVQGATVLLHVRKKFEICPNHSKTYTFSIPALVITSFTASTVSTAGQTVTDNGTQTVTFNATQTITFNATYAGGTGPFKCIFNFGNGSYQVVLGVNGSCSTTHQYYHSGTFQVSITVKGASTSDRVTAHLSVKIVSTHKHHRHHCHEEFHNWIDYGYNPCYYRNNEYSR